MAGALRESAAISGVAWVLLGCGKVMLDYAAAAVVFEPVAGESVLTAAATSSADAAIRPLQGIVASLRGEARRFPLTMIIVEPSRGCLAMQLQPTSNA